MGNDRNRSRRKKRKFYKLTSSRSAAADTTQTDDVVDRSTSCLSAKKLKLDLIKSVETDCNDYFMLINFSILKEMFECVGTCPECDSRLKLADDTSKRMGFSHKLVISCESANCAYVKQTFTSNQIKNSDKQQQGRNPFDVNLRMVISFREIGKGHQPMTDFCRVMNMSCMNVNAFDNVNMTISEAYKVAAEDSMKEAALEVKNLSKETLDSGQALTTVSLDGSWQKRGHSSLNGVVTAISAGKCLDAAVLSKYCRGCRNWEKKKHLPSYEVWKANHNCSLNHVKTSGAMEGAGAVDIFSRSLSNNLIYKYYLGDGDSSSYNDVVSSNPYKAYNILPEKLECVGHVQKRVGARLRNRRKEKKGDQRLTGKGRLTETAINTLQNYFGMAIRQTAANEDFDDETKLYQMKKNIRAVLRHCTDWPDKANRHILCPVGPNSWCRWKKNENGGGDPHYAPKVNLPKWIFDIIEKDFDDLSQDELLKKCLHGQTQNCNEGINNIIWCRCPKNIFVKREILEMGVNSAILSFNEGTSGLFRLFEHLNMDVGVKTSDGSMKKDMQRLRNMTNKEQIESKNRRKTLRGIKKGWVDKENELSSAKCYEKGSF